MTFLKKYVKTVVALGAMVFFVACTNDVVEFNSEIIDNSNFEKSTINIIPVLTTQNRDKVRTSGLNQLLVGQYTHSNFGTVKADLIGQVIPTSYPGSLGDNAEVEAVKLFLPINYTLNDDGVTYSYDGFLGDYSSTLNLQVNTFEYFLEESNLDGVNRVYYSDNSNDGNALVGVGTETFLGSLLNTTFQESNEESTETLEIDLDTDFFQENVLDKIIDFYQTRTDDEDTPSAAEFVQNFKGLKINATNTGNGFVAPVDISDAEVQVYYQNDVEAVTDTISLGFDRVSYGLYDHNHINASAANELYVQGAGGYEVLVDLAQLINDYKATAESEQWLINQAALKVYLKEVEDDTADNLYIYGVDADGNEIALDDYGFLSVGGQVKNSEGDAYNDDLYVEFLITEYIKTVLGVAQEDEDTTVSDDTLTMEDIVELRIKVREFSETSTVSSFSTDAKGVILLNDISSEKAPELKIIYSAL